MSGTFQRLGGIRTIEHLLLGPISYYKNYFEFSSDLFLP